MSLPFTSVFVSFSKTGAFVDFGVESKKTLNVKSIYSGEFVKYITTHYSNVNPIVVDSSVINRSFYINDYVVVNLYVNPLDSVNLFFKEHSTATLVSSNTISPFIAAKQLLDDFENNKS
jgi:hypothetical protein